MNSSELDSVVITPTKFREGYDPQEVDDFLARVRATFVAHENGTSTVGSSSLLAVDVVNQRFQPTKFRAGYDQDEIDDLLDRVVAALRAYEVGSRGRERSAAPGLTVGAMLRSSAFDELQLGRTRIGEGYDMKDVDAFLAAAKASLWVYERKAVRADNSPLTAAEVDSTRFRPVRFTAGYDQDDVDKLLERIAATIATYEATLGEPQRG